MGWIDEIPEGESLWIEAEREGSEDSSTLIYVESGFSTYAEYCGFKIMVSEWVEFGASAGGVPLDVTYQENADGSYTYFVSGHTAENLQLEFLAPPGTDPVGFTFYPPQYSDSVLYETFENNALDLPWSNMQQIPGWPDKWEDYSQNDLLNLSALLDNALQLSFNFSGGQEIYYRAVGINEDIAIGDAWVGFYYSVIDWATEAGQEVDFYLGLYAEKDGYYSGLLLNLNRLTPWFYDAEQLTQAMLDADGEISNCHVDKNGLVAVKPWSMYEASGLEAPPAVVSDKHASASLLVAGDKIKHAMLFAKMYAAPAEDVLFVGSQYEKIIRIDMETMEATHAIGYGTAEGGEYEIYGIDYGTDGYVYAVGYEAYVADSLLLKLRPDDLSIVYKADLGGITLSSVVYAPDDGYLYASEGYRLADSGDIGRIYKVDPSDGSIVGRFEGDASNFDSSYVCIYKLRLGPDGYLYACTSVDGYKLIKIARSTMTLAGQEGGEHESGNAIEHFSLSPGGKVYTGFYTQAVKYIDSAQEWQPNKEYTTDDYVYGASGYVYIISYGGDEGTSGSTEPDWPTTEYAEVSDGSVTWTCLKDDATYGVYRQATRSSSSFVLEAFVDMPEDDVAITSSSAYGQDGYLYVGHEYSESIFKIEPSSMEIVATCTVYMYTAYSMWFGSDGFLYVQADDDGIYKIDPTGFTQVGKYEDPNGDLGGWGEICGNQNRYQKLSNL